MIRTALIALGLLFAGLLVSCAQPGPYYGTPGPAPYPQPGPNPFPPGPVTQPGDRVCGGFTATPSPSCGAGEFCRRTIEAQCGAADQPGVCRPIPQFCTQEFAPVCGCDGRTYSNECTANGNGVSAAYRGECRDVSTPTQPLPQPGIVCPQVYQPVCGTNGRTYGNSCEAGNQPIAYQGECRG